MAANKKSKKVDPMEVETGENSTDSSDSECDDGEAHPDAYKGNEEIQVDFEGRNPIDTDFHGIRQLLQQLFLKAHINLAEMSELIIEQNYIGSVVCQSEMDEEDDDDDDEDDDEGNTIFGITSALNLASKKDLNCIKELKVFLTEKLESQQSSNDYVEIKNILSDTDAVIGFLINERFINIPAQISVPLLENLYKEIKRATDKKMPFNFTHFIMIIKFYRTKSKKNKPSEIIYSNPEEEVICKEAKLSIEYSVEQEIDTGMSGDWLEGDATLKPYRKVVLFEANNLPHLILTIKDFINE